MRRSSQRRHNQRRHNPLITAVVTAYAASARRAAASAGGAAARSRRVCPNVSAPAMPPPYQTPVDTLAQTDEEGADPDYPLVESDNVLLKSTRDNVR